MSAKYHNRLARTKARYLRAYEKWTWDDEVLLTKMLQGNQSIKELSEGLQRGPGAIRSRIRKRERGVYQFEEKSTVTETDMIPQFGNETEDVLQAASQERDVDPPVSIAFCFQWQPVCRSANQQYCYPQPVTRYMEHRYKWPAVYRWLIAPDIGSDPLLMYVGTTKKLCPDRLNAILNPEGNTNSRLAGIFNEHQKQGCAVYLEIITNSGVSAGNELQKPYSLGTQTRRLVLEELLIDYYKQQGFQLINQ